VKVNSPPVIIINITRICSVFWLCATGWRCCSVRLRLSSLQTHYISKLRILLTSSKHNIAACEKPVRALYFWPSERCSQEEKCVCVCVGAEPESSQTIKPLHSRVSVTSHAVLLLYNPLITQIHYLCFSNYTISSEVHVGGSHT